MAPSLPLTTAITVFVPGPVTSTVSRTPSASKSPDAVRTSPTDPGKGAIGPPTGWSCPVVPRANARAAPSDDPDTMTGCPGGGGGGDTGGTVGGTVGGTTGGTTGGT